MHDCIRIPELLTQVCYHANDPDSNNASDLVALAMTCKAFKDPALDVLYYELHYTAHLFMCLPRDLWTLRKDEGPNAAAASTLFFSRAMVHADWLILQTYRQRVRIVHLNTASKFISVDSEALSAVRSFSGDNLLPNLRDYRVFNSKWRFVDRVPLLRGIMHFPELFFGPTLTTLSLDWLESTSLHTLNALSRTSPLIEKLSFTLYKSVGDQLLEKKLLEALENVTRSLKKIRIFQANFVHFESPVPFIPVLAMLATLPSLQYLNIRCRNLSLSFPSASVDRGTNLFPQLTRLRLAGNACQIAHLMSSLHAPSLEVVVLCFEQCEGDNAIPQTIAYMANWISNSAFPIRGVKLQFPEQYPPNLAAFKHLRPLFRFPTIQHFRLVCFPHPAFDDDQIDELSGAFSDLRTLSLLWSSNKYHSGLDTRVTLMGLVSLLRNCPKLAELGLTVDVTEEDTPHSRSDIGTSAANVCQTSLTKWEVFDSFIMENDIQYVSRVLACTAPHLSEVVYTAAEASTWPHSVVEEDAEIWRQVNERLECCMEARKHYVRHVYGA
ncbi:hypothetical protein CONPUDRAFT_144977 [Coniophora puteana RWD-64-598 SS2]|uniref:F-box domain-containing protein n=1 Tax=Coniophora puteana (strain RWD-64-598) TaxID=741705 RepID=A0A5M3MLA7_CONPW|nr:uncharacterized protein CONPUDRAFT_144977 [Coniophora puteana RWD-64-598 SS2]EIW79846.1 hypothetical protein CONPUDRAFT_144977 [Coniophora puteana RWD-64-598 SS2]